MSELVSVDIQDNIQILRLNRPDANALSQAMYAALADAIQNAENDSNIRCNLITGTEEALPLADLVDFAAGPAGEFEASPVDVCLAWPQPTNPSWPPSPALPSVSAPPCCCTVTWCLPATTPLSRCPLPTWAYARGRLQPAAASLAGPGTGRRTADARWC